ncbi:hypothetical protein Ga0123462_0587 [Mariprofundus ferrinatatus]|uniref:GTA TIM-barrel-like domain-containing protein n=1 Tax=Mariprofundus ferrinatatus TaxID=1921087 RepID=A0A2K8L2E4_9PROT|nr:hypothetical protein [Mariprofundus ferrinatatus]ATX81457.1 hypothetical protein Ga0123462_0587 [Mariprofundus ferrinatatus]
MAKLAFLLGVLMALGGCAVKEGGQTASAHQAKATGQSEASEIFKKRKQARRSSFGRDELTPWRGFNALQTSRVAWDSSAARRSLMRMGAVGANAVALIPFVRQSSPYSTAVMGANNVTDAQLIAAIKSAHELGMKVVVKPQILVTGSWAGEISFTDSGQRDRWFDSYSAHIIRYARLSQSMGVEAFAIGTELSKIAKDLPWPRLISQLRREFRGVLTYAAHNVEGVERFPYWDKLDVIGISSYPSLGDMGEYDEMLAHIELNLYKLSQAVKANRRKPVWLLEVGIPSAEGASSQPWEWRSLGKGGQRTDLTMQTAAVAAWLNAIKRLQYVDGVFLWCWYSDPQAGGEENIDYTVQNKPSEIVIRQYWRN